MPSFLRNGVLGTLVSLRLPQLLMVLGISSYLGEREVKAVSQFGRCVVGGSVRRA